MNTDTTPAGTISKARQELCDATCKAVKKFEADTGATVSHLCVTRVAQSDGPSVPAITADVRI